MEPKCYSIKEVYPSERGLHLVFPTIEEAEAFFADGRSRGITSNEIEGNVVIKRFPKKKPALIKEQV